MKPKTIKLRRKHRTKFHDIGFDNDFVDVMPDAQEMKEKIEKLDCYKVKIRK